MVINQEIKSGSPSDLRRVHRGLVLQSIHASQDGSRTELAEQTGLSTMAISRIIRELLDANLLEEVGKRDREGNPGRRQTLLRINPAGAYVVGLVISAFGHEVALLNTAGECFVRRKLSLAAVKSADAAMEIAADAINAVIEESGVERQLVLGIGIAIAAFVQQATGTVVRAPYLGWRTVELGQKITEATGLPVIVENIADAINAAEIAENADKRARDDFLVHISLTIGASYIHQGALIRGANYSAGQIGHLPDGDSSLTCSCGATDCLNCHASGWAVLVKAGVIDSPRFEVDRIDTYATRLSEMATGGAETDTPESALLYDAGWHLGRALLNVSLMIDPATVTLAGKMPEFPAYVAGCRAAWNDPALRRVETLPDLRVGTVAPIGAAGMLALNAFFYSASLDIERLTAGAAPVFRVEAS